TRRLEGAAHGVLYRRVFVTALHRVERTGERLRRGLARSRRTQNEQRNWCGRTITWLAGADALVLERLEIGALCCRQLSRVALRSQPQLTVRGSQRLPCLVMSAGLVQDGCTH